MSMLLVIKVNPWACGRECCWSITFTCPHPSWYNMWPLAYFLKYLHSKSLKKSNVVRVEFPSHIFISLTKLWFMLIQGDKNFSCYCYSLALQEGRWLLVEGQSLFRYSFGPSYVSPGVSFARRCRWGFYNKDESQGHFSYLSNTFSQCKINVHVNMKL